MKQIAKRLLALIALLVLLCGSLTEAAAAPLPGPARGTAAAGWAEAAERAAASESRLQAKSRKKKNSKSGATATPAPEAQAEEDASRPTFTPVPEGPITDPQSIADYLFSHSMTLPENFITKQEARRLGWDSRRNYVSDVAPGKSIGGDYFGNYEGKLPVVRGVSYHEADCNYTGGRRKEDRIVYSTDGRVWVTLDHYNTFKELFPSAE